MCKKERYGVSSRRRKGDDPVLRLSDLWIDIAPADDVRQRKALLGKAPSLKLLDRILELATHEGDTVFDPFSDSGTTLIVAEAKKRRWVGVVLEGLNEVKDRFANMTMEATLVESFRTERQLLLNWFTLASPADRRR
jgi:site-specific DNA-methyltransferase (adenine-specific)